MLKLSLITVLSMSALQGFANEKFTAPEVKNLSHYLPSGKTEQQNLLQRESGRKFLILEFSQVNCYYCAEQLPNLAKLAADTAATTTTKIVYIDSVASTVVNYVKSMSASHQYPVVLDTSRFAWRAYEDEGTPMTYVINENNKVIFSHLSTLSGADLAKIRNLVK